MQTEGSELYGEAIPRPSRHIPGRSFCSGLPGEAQVCRRGRHPPTRTGRARRAHISQEQRSTWGASEPQAVPQHPALVQPPREIRERNQKCRHRNLGETAQNMQRLHRIRACPTETTLRDTRGAECCSRCSPVHSKAQYSSLWLLKVLIRACK